MAKLASTDVDQEREPFHAWIVLADFLFVFLERVTLLAAVWAVATVTRAEPLYSVPVTVIYAMGSIALIFSSHAQIMRIARQEGAFRQEGWRKAVIDLVLLALFAAVSFGVPVIVRMIAESVRP